jgi:curved DNA-binding protein CbpA
MPPQPDFYAIFGVSPSATQEEIRAAHRELVKRYHPDIYSTSGDKARATEKLREINAAYAVLGNVERRRAYDARHAEAPRPPPRPRPQAAPSRAAQSGGAQARRTVGRAPRRRPRRPFPIRFAEMLRSVRWKSIFTRRRMAGALGGIILIMVAAHLLNRPPEITPLWLLVQKTEVNGVTNEAFASTGGWEQVGSFGVRAECARMLRARVRADQDEGSQAVFDEKNGTMAITVLLNGGKPAAGATQSAVGQKELTKRVRQYECRMVRVRQSESWLRRKFRQIGIAG